MRGGEVMKNIISTENAPAAIGPYSQGVATSGQFVIVSGQLPIDPATGAFAGEDIASQTEQSLKNIEAILKEAGYSVEDVVETTVMLSDIADFAAMNEVYAKHFTQNCPARCAYQVAALPRNAKVEIRAVACK